MNERTRLRKAISIAFGLILATAGLGWFVYMFLFTVEPVKVLYWMMPTTIFGAGIAILWDDVRSP